METVAVNKTFRTAWRSFYKIIALMILIFLCACFVSYKGWLPATILWVVVAVVLLGLFCYMATKRVSEKLILRDNPEEFKSKEIALETGLLGSKSIEIGLVNVRHIEITKSILQRILNIGDLKIASSGTSENEIVIKNIPNPEGVRDEIQEHVRKYTMPGKSE